MEIKMYNRKIDFEKIQNVRDMGSLETTEGRVIIPGLLIRSANLSNATASDKIKLEKECHLTKIIDLRASMEKQEKPDVKMDSVTYLSIPIFDESVMGISHEKDTHEKQKTMRIPEMEKLYCMMVTNEACRANLRKAIRTIMEHDFTTGSVLWHCTEGKDRCGLVSAILLAALNVDRETIMEDYLLTNEVNEAKAEMFYQRMIMAGKSEAEAEAVKNAFLAKASYLEAAFSVIDEQYSDMENYLKEGLGISEEIVSTFRENVLSEKDDER